VRIAFLEDEAEQSDRIVALLSDAGNHVHAFNRGRALLNNLRSETYELLLLDWELPDISGYEVLSTLRTNLHISTPVLFLTHRDSEEDVVKALNAGADDFLVKPARKFELLARIESVCRRARDVAEQQAHFDIAPFHISLNERYIERDGNRLELTRREFEVAVMLLRNVGKVLSRGHIMEALWGRGDATTTRTVDMHVSRVRQVLGLSSAIGLRLTAIYGYGYRLERTRSEADESMR
jgi:two-component system, OmpR family, response regulator RegX3